MNAERMRRNAAHCIRLAEETADETQRQRYLCAAKAWLSVARNKERVDETLVPEESLMGAIDQVA
jgi:hypothetical protein